MEKTEEKVEKAAREKAFRTTIYISAVISLFATMVVIATGFPGVAVTLFLFALSGLIYAFLYDYHYEQCRKKFSEEVEIEEKGEPP